MELRFREYNRAQQVAGQNTVIYSWVFAKGLSLSSKNLVNVYIPLV